MELFEFASERQVIFQAEIDGRQRLIAFGDRSGNGTSVLQTKEPKVAEAIRRTALFRRGAIVETTAPNQPKTEGSQDANGKSQDEGEKLKDQVFNNITQAKDWLNRTFNIPKNQLRNSEAAIKAAKEHGINIVLTKE